MSPLHRRVAAEVAGSEAACRALGAAPARAQRPAVVLAALHDLALDGGPALDPATVVDTLLTRTDLVLATALRRPLLADQTGRSAVLVPLVAEAAHRVGADAIGLVSSGRPAGLDLLLDRVGLSWGGSPSSAPASPVQVGADVVGEGAVPLRDLPVVVTRVLVDRHPLDVTDPDDARWVRACLPPDRPTTLPAELALAATDPPVARTRLAEALALVPGGALPVVTTAWALGALSPARRSQFLDELLGAGRPLAWVSAEGVGVAPGVPTLGDRPASGHSTLGLTLVDGPGARGEALGRCWARGRMLSWLGGATA